MPEQAVWQVKRVTSGIPVPTPATLRAAVRMVGPPLLLGLLAVVVATQLQARVWRGQAQVYFNVRDPNLIASTTALTTLWPTNGATLYLGAQAEIARSPALAERSSRSLAFRGSAPGSFSAEAG